jgi:hypothetical protein
VPSTHFNTQFRGKSEKDLSNLRQEIEILRRLKQENIILLLDAFETAHEFCLVTEVFPKGAGVINSTSSLRASYSRY